MPMALGLGHACRRLVRYSGKRYFGAFVQNSWYPPIAPLNSVAKGTREDEGARKGLRGTGQDRTGQTICSATYPSSFRSTVFDVEVGDDVVHVYSAGTGKR